MKRHRVTSSDVAKRAGVSRTTVSFVLNNVQANISPETKTRVLAAAQELGYVPNASARSLARRRTHTIALVLIRDTAALRTDAFIPLVIQGLVDVLRPAGYRMIYEPLDSADAPDIYLNLAKGRQIDGIALSGPRSDDIQLRELIDSGFPLVMMGRLHNGSGCSVDVDNRAAARTAVKHLTDLGHKRIGCITNGPLSYTSAEERLEGYRDALEASQLSYNQKWVRYGNFEADSGYQAAMQILNHGAKEPPTALFVSSDVVAVGAMRAISELGLKIPQDISLVGFDDVPMARHFCPPLTTIRLPGTELGRRAGTMLMDCIEKGHQVPSEMLSTELIVRQSSMKR